MADTGVASRRVCESMIETGHVTVNGKTVTKLPIFVNPEVDDVRVDGLPLPKPERPIFLMLNKPPRVLSTTRDDASRGVPRTTVMDLVDHPSKPTLFPVGRLGFHASGLVILTNHGDTANLLTHPRYGVPKTYEVLVKRALSQADLTEIEAAFNRRAKRGFLGASPVQFKLMKHDGDRSLLQLTLQEGPNRQVSDVLTRLGCPVKRVRRIAIGPVTLRGVAVGGWRELEKREVAILMKAADATTSTSARPGAEKGGRTASTRPGAVRASRPPSSRRSEEASS